VKDEALLAEEKWDAEVDELLTALEFVQYGDEDHRLEWVEGLSAREGSMHCCASGVRRDCRGDAEDEDEPAVRNLNAVYPTQ
jgi:hypothetical protein